MRHPLTAAMVSIASIAVACDSFESANETSDAGAADAGATDAGITGEAGGDASSPQSGCGSLLPGFLVCSDFDTSTSLDQPTQPSARTWDPESAGMGQLGIQSGRGHSPENALVVAGNGAGSIAQVRLRNVTITKDQMRLKMKLRAVTLPGPGDVYIAGLNFDNIAFGLVLHATGTVGLAQTPNGMAIGKFDPPNPQPVGTNSWKNVDLMIDRRSGKTEIAARVEGSGTPTTLAAVPSGDVLLTVGIGYCDGACGSPKLEFDDVVLTEE